jgi:hypothetical protein
MTATVTSQTRSRRYVWVLVLTQLVLVIAYGYGAVAYVTTDRAFFPEQSTPFWAWPAVVATGIGWLPAFVCVTASLLASAFSPELRADRRQWVWLRAATIAATTMLAVMVTPAGWVLFNWYVG